jgi:hypothetical protein
VSNANTVSECGTVHDRLIAAGGEFAKSFLKFVNAAALWPEFVRLGRTLWHSSYHW